MLTKPSYFKIKVKMGPVDKVRYRIRATQFQLALTLVNWLMQMSFVRNSHRYFRNILRRLRHLTNRVNNLKKSMKYERFRLTCFNSRSWRSEEFSDGLFIIRKTIRRTTANNDNLVWPADE